MTNILADRIRKVSLTRTQQIIADYFMKNQERIGSLSSLQAAKEIGVSDASIIRFCRTIGFEGFADLKAHIYDTLVEDSYSALSLSDRMAQSMEQYPEEDIFSQYLNLMQNNLTETFHRNSPAEFERAADILATAGHRYVIGLRGCRGIAVQFSRLLSFIFPHVSCLQDGECSSINAVQDIQEGDALIMFSVASYYKIDLRYLQLARERGARICLVADGFASPLSGCADCVLLARTDHMSFFNSMLGTELIAEYLLTLLARRTDFQSRIAKRDEMTQDQLL